MEDRAVPADLTAVLAAAAAPVVVCGREYRFAYANAAFCRSVHKTWPELDGRKVADVFPE
ncbi:MAG: PAS domain-containing protein [Hyphomonas sp.]|uniref:PAS domain-containing protein n=1 Tax=Hyphomonas sp. TaxID=87 RepID=UPI0034A05015